MPDTPELLRVPEAARRLGLTTRETYRLIFDGELPHVRDPDIHVGVTVAAVQQYLEQHANPEGATP